MKDRFKQKSGALGAEAIAAMGTWTAPAPGVPGCPVFVPLHREIKILRSTREPWRNSRHKVPGSAFVFRQGLHPPPAARCRSSRSTRPWPVRAHRLRLVMRCAMNDPATDRAGGSASADAEPLGGQMSGCGRRSWRRRSARSVARQPERCPLRYVALRCAQARRWTQPVRPRQCQTQNSVGKLTLGAIDLSAKVSL